MHFAGTNRARGILCLLAIPIVVVVGGCFLLWTLWAVRAGFPPEAWIFIWLLKTVALLGTPFLSALLWKKGKSAFQQDSRIRFFSDDRRPVIYLRPFSADSSSGFLASPSTGKLENAARYVGVPTDAVKLEARSEESDLVSDLDDFGAVLAIGRPGETIPPLGAPRLYVNDADWQEAVRVFVHFARLVFVRAGETAGLRWELGYLRSECDPGKIITFFPPTNGLKRKAAISLVEDELGISLPAELSRQGKRPASYDGYIVMFGKEWQPTISWVRPNSVSPTLRKHLRESESALASDAAAELKRGWALVHDDLRVASGAKTESDVT